MSEDKTLKSFSEISAQIDSQIQRESAQNYGFQKELREALEAIFKEENQAEIGQEIISLGLVKTELAIVLKTIAQYNKIKHQQNYLIKAINQRFINNPKINVESLKIELLEDD